MGPAPRVDPRWATTIAVDASHTTAGSFTPTMESTILVHLCTIVARTVLGTPRPRASDRAFRNCRAGVAVAIAIAVTVAVAIAGTVAVAIAIAGTAAIAVTVAVDIAIGRYSPDRPRVPAG